MEYEIRDTNEKKLLGLIWQIQLVKNNTNLPSKSKLNEKRSDVVGKAFAPNNILTLDYNFSYDNNFKSSNYDSYQQI